VKFKLRLEALYSKNLLLLGQVPLNLTKLAALVQEAGSSETAELRTYEVEAPLHLLTFPELFASKVNLSFYLIM
jgi:hypothetical protein